MRWRVFFVVVVAATAGCTGFGGGGADHTTLTPAPVPSDVPQSGPGSTLAPGVWADGRVDPGRLAEAQRTAVGEESFRWVATRNSSGSVGNVSTRSQAFDVIVLENATHFSRNATLTSGHPVDRFYRLYSEYSNGTYHFVRATSYYWDGTRYDISAADPSRERLVNATALATERYLSVESTRVEQVTEDGTTLYRITGKNAVGVGGPSVQNYTVTAFVTPAGLVRNLSARYRIVQGGSVEDVEYRFAFEQIGNVTVAQPSWIDSAHRHADNGSTRST